MDLVNFRKYFSQINDRVYCISEDYISEIITTIVMLGVKGYWDFRISDLIKNPDRTDIYPLW